MKALTTVALGALTTANAAAHGTQRQLVAKGGGGVLKPSATPLLATHNGLRPMSDSESKLLAGASLLSLPFECTVDSAISTQ